VFIIFLYEIDRLLEEIYIRKTIFDFIKKQRLAQYTKTYKLADIVKDITHTKNRARKLFLKKKIYQTSCKVSRVPRYSLKG
jgi:hypothetical protein